MTILFGTSSLSMDAAGFAKGVIAGTGSGLAFGSIGALVDSGKENLSTTLTVSSAAVGGLLGCLSGTRTNTILENGLIGAGAGALSAFLTSKLVNMITNQTISGPIGSVLLGTSLVNSNIMSMDCWKDVLRCESKERSNGKILNDVLFDERVKNVFFKQDESGIDLVVENVWDEKFKIDFLVLDDGQVFAHANKLF